MAHSPLYIRLMNSKQWRQLRAEWLTDHPLCEECRRKGKIRAARAIHHVVPVESGRTDSDCEHLCFSRGNLMSVCFECHSEIHRAEHSHTKAMHHQRQSERLQQWIARHQPHK